jgi:hypothetical protein
VRAVAVSILLAAATWLLTLSAFGLLGCASRQALTASPQMAMAPMTPLLTYRPNLRPEHPTPRYVVWDCPETRHVREAQDRRIHTLTCPAVRRGQYRVGVALVDAGGRVIVQETLMLEAR